ncbi:hypothetical protein JTB14_037875 [Gonioctena quinquepunctata]|nr:hypothetical protein JTB14_037875 [Gonioctena quinquepunctata]
MDRTINREYRKYKNKTPRAEGFLRVEDELKNLQEDIKRTARERTQQALDHIERTERNNKNEYIPYLKLKESNHSTIYNHWLEKLTEENKMEILELENRRRIVGTDEAIREEFAPRFQVKEVRKGKPADERKQPSKQQISRPSTSAGIETSNRFGVLPLEGESSRMETEEEVEKEEETSRGGKKQREENKSKQTPQRNIEREPNKDARNRSIKGKTFKPVPQALTEEIPIVEQDQGQKAKKQEQQGTKERNMPRIIVEGTEWLGPTLRGRLKVVLKKGYQEKYFIRASNEIRMDGNELKEDPSDEGKSQDNKNRHQGPQGPALPGKTGQNQEGKKEQEPGAQVFQPTLPIKICLDDTDRARDLQNAGSQEGKSESDPSEEEFQPQNNGNTSGKEGIETHSSRGRDNTPNNTPERNIEQVEETTLVPNRDIFQGISDKEGSVHSYIGNVENEEVIIFPEQPRKQTANLLSASEVEKTVHEGGSVLQFEIGEEGNLIPEISPKTPEILNKTVMERPTNIRQKRRSRLMIITRSTGEESSGSSCKQGQSEPSDPRTPKRKRPGKMSPELAAKKKVMHDERLKSKDNEPCDCGGTQKNHRILYEISDGVLERHLCLGLKAATKEKVGREVYTKEEHNKLRAKLNDAAIESERTKKCVCGGTTEDHKYLVDINDTSYKIKFLGSAQMMHTAAGRTLVGEIDWQSAEAAIKRKEK